MRVLALAILAISSVSVTSSARAQTYDPAYPVCLHVWTTRGSNWYDCSYTTLPQCNASASARGAVCHQSLYTGAPVAGATGVTAEPID
jgi:hypothetical protein